MIKEDIVAWAEAHRDEFAADLGRLIAVRSVRGEARDGMPFGEGPAEALRLGLELCEGYGLRVTNYDNYAGSADLAADKPPMLDILAHLDVVGEGDGWETEPYTMTLKADGCLYGRGVADDKGGLLAAAYAMRCVRELGLPLRCNCRLILGCDEETDMEDTRWYYLKNKPAPCTTTPDANWPVCNVEKGFFRPELRMSLEPETATPRVVSLDGGFRINVVPTDAAAVMTGMDELALRTALLPLAAEIGVGFDVEPCEAGLRLTVHGRGCHAAMPETGNNGLTALVRLLCELPLADCGSTRALAALNAVLPHGDWSGRAAGIAQCDELSGALTCSFTQLKIDANGLWGVCDCRVPLCASDENCRRPFAEKLGALSFTVSGEMLPGHYTPAEGEFIQTLLRSYERYSGKKGYCYSMGGGTYVHHIPGGVAFGTEPPDFDTRMHGANERIPLDELLRCMEIYADVIASLCGEAE